MALSDVELLLELPLLFALLLPLGAVLVRAAEWAAGRRVRLSVPERLLSAFFASGAFFFVLASLPLPIFDVETVVGAIVAGAAILAFLWWSEDGAPARESIRWLTSAPGALLVLGAFGLFVLEALATGTASMPNANDGSWESLFVQLIVRGHSVPWTFRPYADSGIIYPAGAAVWMSLPVLLFGWLPIEGPVAVPTLFLGLSLVGAYCWGERLGGLGTRRGVRIGLSLAAFFGLVGSWPRFFVGGSYDFAFCLPLLLMVLGWLPGFVRRDGPSVRETVAFGVLLGTCACLSAAVGELLPVLLVGFLIAFAPRTRGALARWALGLAGIVAVGMAFVVRTLIGFAVWYSYPAHALSAVGNPPYAAAPVGPPPPAVSYMGDLDPFVLDKPKISPLPILSVEILLLFTLGLVLLVLWKWLPSSPLRKLLPRGLVEPLFVTMTVTFAVTAMLVVLVPSPIGTAWLAEVSNIDEESYFLFLCYQAVAALPVILAVERLAARVASDSDLRPATTPALPSPRSLRSTQGTLRGTLHGRVVLPTLAAVLVTATLALGAGVTVAQAPGYLHNHLHELASVTAGDFAALDWAGAHLPACARVLAAPDSAAMFLPLYSSSQLVFPVFPLSSNLSYSVAVGNLTQGIYSDATRAALLDLGVTEVFVTGATSVSFPPFEPAPLENSTDFVSLFHSGDAEIFLFVPGAAATGCSPS